MTVFQVRIFSSGKWKVIRTYDSNAEALEFANNLSVKWHIEKISLAEANQMAGA
jgi:hypothetical protein